MWATVHLSTPAACSIIMNFNRQSGGSIVLWGSPAVYGYESDLDDRRAGGQAACKLTLLE